MTAQLPLLDIRIAPATRLQCEDGPRPCPYTTCRHHLWRFDERAGRPHHKAQAWVNRALPLVRSTGAHSCALDLVQTHPDGMSFEQVGQALGMTKQRAEQYQARAIEQVKYVLYVVALARIAGLEHELEELRSLGVDVDDLDEDIARAEMVRRGTLELVEGEAAA